MPGQDADTVQEVRAPVATSTAAEEPRIQPSGFLLEMSLDWIVLRASENVANFLGESHVTLIDEPLSRFVQAQALHDLRNHFSRLSGSTGISRAYRVRLADDRPRLDIAFQVSNGRALLEGVPSPETGLGEAIGAVGGLVDGLAGLSDQALLEGAARRVRALTGYDRCLVECAGKRAESCRAATLAPSGAILDVPAIFAETGAAPVPIFPRKPGDRSVDRALLKSPSADVLGQLRDLEIGSAMNVPLVLEGRELGHIQCESRAPREPNLELHAATELFGQMLALRFEVDRLRG